MPDQLEVGLREEQARDDAMLAGFDDQEIRLRELDLAQDRFVNRVSGRHLRVDDDLFTAQTVGGALRAGGAARPPNA